MHTDYSKDMFLLETAHQIGRFIHEHCTEDSKDNSGKPYGIYSESFKSGPNPYYTQTEKGLYLEESYDLPCYIHTPYGNWTIVNGGSGDWKKVMEAIKEPLGLELIQERTKVEVGGVKWGYAGPLWAITKWKDQPLEDPKHRERSDYVPYKKVQEVWREFIANYEDLSPKK